MTEPHAPKPLPARPPAEPAREKPTPARAMSVDAQAAAPEADVPEVSVEDDGRQWTVRVLGRSGSASSPSAPLLQLGFWEGTAEGGHSAEVLVVGTSLAGLSEEQLVAARARAVPPRDPTDRPSFFADVGQPRRR